MYIALGKIFPKNLFLTVFKHDMQSQGSPVLFIPYNVQ